MLLLTCLTAFAEPGTKRDERRARKDSIKVAEMVGAHRKGTKIKLDGIVLDKDSRRCCFPISTVSITTKHGRTSAGKGVSATAWSLAGRC